MTNVPAQQAELFELKEEFTKRLGTADATVSDCAAGPSHFSLRAGNDMAPAFSQIASLRNDRESLAAQVTASKARRRLVIGISALRESDGGAGEGQF